MTRTAIPRPERACTRAAQCAVRSPEVQTAAVDVERARAKLHHLTAWTGIESPVKRRLVIERTAARRERLVYHGPIGNTARGVESGIPSRHPVVGMIRLRRRVFTLREHGIRRELAVAGLRATSGRAANLIHGDNKEHAQHDKQCTT
jgi:hypothetical protein